MVLLNGVGQWSWCWSTLLVLVNGVGVGGGQQCWSMVLVLLSGVGFGVGVCVGVGQRCC